MPLMEATIDINDLRKRYGPAVALDGRSFTVRPGHLTGFAGPAGSPPRYGSSSGRTRPTRGVMTSSSLAERTIFRKVRVAAMAEGVAR
jgi:ABC-2 type transport system ATP-binding protein